MNPNEKEKYLKLQRKYKAKVFDKQGKAVARIENKKLYIKGGTCEWTKHLAPSQWETRTALPSMFKVFEGWSWTVESDFGSNITSGKGSAKNE